MTRETLASTLEEIALLLELKGDNPFKVRAYRTGADTVRQFPGDILALAREEQLDGIKGIGEALRQKLHELAMTGSLEFLEKLKGEFPVGLFDLFDLQGLGPKKIKALYDSLGVDSVARLRELCEAGEVEKLPGFGKKSVEGILEAIEFRERNVGRFRLGDVAVPAKEILSALREHPYCLRADIAGSYRRSRETLHDLDFLVATSQPESLIAHFVSQTWVDHIIQQGSTKASIRLASGLQCDLRAVSNEEFACALAYFTGGKEHNVAMRGRALERGYTLNEYRLAVREGANAPEAPVFEDETQLHRFLGLDYIAPELRENTGEIECAADGQLPRLIELSNLRGTFHCHTTASDGEDSLEDMAAAAIELGLQYLGISDHSKSSFQANGLDEKRLRDQISQIRALNEQFLNEGVKFRILAGSEVDILKDGSLDYDDELLSELDFVVASVHNAMSLSESAMTARLIRAVSHPRVTMLGHMTGRLLLTREPYAVDIPAVIEACAEHNTVIELNCSPARLDMDWRWWKFAKEKGIKCSINTDAHSVSGLGWLAIGARVARKGWLTREDVINTRSRTEIESWLRLDSL